ncbi:MAG: hypothetical protein IKO42_02180 [Opitutales bacterium]|nr:hypothetical protein [Opitutales bacterium]
MTLFKDIKPRFFIVFCVNLALFWLICLVNDALSGIGVYVYLPAFLIVPSALFLGFGGAMFMAVFFGLMFEAQTPLDGALTPVLFAAAAFVVFEMRQKFRSLDSFGITWLCWIANMLMYLIAVLFIFPRAVAPFWGYVLRVFTDAVFTSFMAVLFSAYVVNLNKSVAYLLGVPLNVKEES